MAELPPEVVTDILTRLPVKSLLRFRCVSKSWYALIDSTCFTRLHLQQSAENKTNRNLVIADRTRINFVSLDSLDVTVTHEPPFNSEPLGAQVLGSCDGLILLHFPSVEFGLRPVELCLWNPSTRSYQQIPSQSIDITLPMDTDDSDEYFLTLGLGYDPVTDDYKVVRMIICYYECIDTYASEVMVYSLKLNSWKKVQDLPYYPCYHIRSSGVYASGALHWNLVEDCGDGHLKSFITAFDLATEEHRSVPLPDFGNDEKNFLLNVAVLEGCLCLLPVYPECHVDVWVMKDYGVVESWIKLFSVEQPYHIRDFEEVYPMAYSKNNEEILLVRDDEELLWFNLKADEVREINICGIPSSFDAEVYVESLVRFGTGRGAARTRKEGKDAEKDCEEKLCQRGSSLSSNKA